MTTFLFTTVPTNDLGLPTCSLPIARELAGRGHGVLFCSPAQAPSRLVADAGFDNLIPRHPIYDIISGDQSLQGLVRFIASDQRRQRYGNLFRFFSLFIPAWPIKLAPKTLEVWNMDHAGTLMGLLNEGFVRACCSALQAMMVECGADVIVDFWNPLLNNQNMLAQALLVRYAVERAVERASASAVELLGGMAFIENSEVSYLYAASRALAFHPPSRTSMSDSLADYLVNGLLQTP